MHKNEYFIKDVFRDFIAKALCILDDELKNSTSDDHRSKEEIMSFYRLFDTTGNKESFFNLFGEELIEKSKERKSINIQSRSNHIYILALFERFRNDLMNHAFKNIKKLNEKFRKSFVNIVEKNKDEKLKNKLLAQGLRDPNNLINQLDKIHGQQFQIERNMFGLRDISDQKMTQDSLANFIIGRDIRNLLIHRSNKSDEKLFSSIRSGIGGTVYRNNDKLLSELFCQKGYFGISNLETNIEIEIDFITIVYLFFDIIYLSFIMTSNAFGKKFSKDVCLELCDFINSTMCIALKSNASNFKKRLVFPLLHIYCNNLIESSHTNIDYNSDMLMSNYIILNKLTKTSIVPVDSIIKNIADKSYFSKLKSMQLARDKKIKDLIKKIEDRKIKKIIINYVKDDDIELIKSIEEFKNDDTIIQDWTLIIDKCRSSSLIKQYLEFDKRRKKVMERKKLSSKIEV